MSPTLAGRRVLVTAGPTWVRIDAVRYLGNLSSGATGLEVARRAAAAGAEVTLLLGPTRVAPSDADRSRIRVLPFVTFDDLHEAVRREVGSRAYAAMVHAAAVSDYRPVSEERGKLPSGEDELVLRLRPTPKIVDEVKELDPGILLVKFKLEVGRTEEELLSIARDSRARSRAELVVANDLQQMDAERHHAFILDEAGLVAQVETTAALAERLVEAIASRVTPAGRQANGIMVARRTTLPLLCWLALLLAGSARAQAPVPRDPTQQAIAGLQKQVRTLRARVGAADTQARTDRKQLTAAIARADEANGRAARLQEQIEALRTAGFWAVLVLGALALLGLLRRSAWRPRELGQADDAFGRELESAERRLQLLERKTERRTE